MAEWLKQASQWHEMYCLDPEVMGSNQNMEGSQHTRSQYAMGNQQHEDDSYTAEVNILLVGQHMAGVLNVTHKALL